MDCRMLVAISLVVEMSFSYQGYANICGPEVKEESEGRHYKHPVSSFPLYKRIAMSYGSLLARHVCY